MVLARCLTNKGLESSYLFYLPTTSLPLFLPLQPSLSSTLQPTFLPLLSLFFPHHLPHSFIPLSLPLSLPPSLPFHTFPLLSISLSSSVSISLSPQPELCQSISQFMAFVHGSVNATSKIYLANERRYNYTTPKSFLELVSNTILLKMRCFIAPLEHYLFLTVIMTAMRKM